VQRHLARHHLLFVPPPHVNNHAELREDVAQSQLKYRLQCTNTVQLRTLNRITPPATLRKPMHQTIASSTSSGASTAHEAFSNRSTLTRKSDNISEPYSEVLTDLPYGQLVCTRCSAYFVEDLHYFDHISICVREPAEREKEESPLRVHPLELVFRKDTSSASESLPSTSSFSTPTTSLPPRSMR